MPPWDTGRIRIASNFDITHNRTEAFVKLTFLAVLGAIFLMVMAGMASAQQKGDLALGFGTLISTPSSSATGSYAPQSVGGGLYPTFSVDFLLRHHLGVSGEISWRLKQNLYEGYEPFRPIFYDINGIYSRRIGKSLGVEAMAGIGAESARFYSGQYNCNFITCTDYTSSNHFLEHVGVGVKIYVHGNFFIRPEAHLYLIQTNTIFSSGRAERVGASIGYTF
jgi:outer membrane protein W